MGGRLPRNGDSQPSPLLGPGVETPGPQRRSPHTYDTHPPSELEEDALGDDHLRVGDLLLGELTPANAGSL
eukprot:15452399-Alexandrium_andersonii.AAC.1